MAVEDIAPGETAFLLSPTAGDEHAPCRDLLDRGDPDDTAVLFIALTDTPAQRISFWEEHVGAHPARISVVSAGGTDDAGDATGVADVRHVRSPGNLTRFGVQITEALDDLRTEYETIVVCFHSLSTLLQYAGTNQAFQFMQVLTDHFKHAGAIAHVHMSSDAHDSQTIATFTQVFDAVVELADDGSRKVTM